MKCFLKGALGVFFLLIFFAIAMPQYSDHQAKAEVSNWLAQIRPLQQEIEMAAREKKSLLGVKKEIKIIEPTHPGPSYFQLTDTGMIIMRGGQEEQVILLIPSLSEDKVSWHCIGGPKSAMPEKCK